MVVQSHRGFRDWVVQRLSAVIIGAYTVFILYHLLCDPMMGYAKWQALFHHTGMRVATMVVLLAVLWHAWIGLWTVFTDYVKCSKLRFVLESAVFILFFVYIVWAILILW